ncbi:MAG: beta/gamma crystallin-related protein [Thermoanaerobaculia bacterium]
MSASSSGRRTSPTPKNHDRPTRLLIGFDDRARSVTIGRGVWELCEKVNFGGRCVTLDRSVSDLDAYGMRDRVSSVRPVGPQPRR